MSKMLTTGMPTVTHDGTPMSMSNQNYALVQAEQQVVNSLFGNFYNPSSYIQTNQY